ncbi:putative beta-glucosidase [Helianthus annuus]|nr:putative beta-glucosidase [Helianthus annuus]
MKPNIFFILLLFLIYALATLLEASTNSDGGFILEENEETRIKRSDFPSGFLFGTGTSAYQVEGAYLEDAKSLSNWDVFCHSLGCGENGENGDIADDHYHMFLKDIELMHSLGIQAYRFSVSWARILPRGRFGKVNPAGIMFYNKIIDNLILKGIEPFVTIHHVEFPQELEDIYGSWLNPEMQEEFIYFADACFKSFGDRVKYWITINEPLLLAEMAYELGVFPPFRCSGPFGNCLDGNSDPKQGGSIGLTVNSKMYEPLTNSELDHQAARRAFVFQSGWTLDPLIFGDYPEEVKEYLGDELPSFSHDEKNFLKNSIDFIGINHYSTTYAKDCTNSCCSATENCAIQGFVGTVGERDGVLIGEHTAVEGSYVVPRGMEEIVNLIKIRYNNKPMFITENEGADVRGYFAWSFMDSYEWLQGYDVKYGLHYVDRQTLTRTPKLSAKWYKNFLTNNTDLVNMEASREN